METQKKIIKNKIKNIIYYNISNIDYNSTKNFRQWCKTYKIKFFIVNNFKLAIKLNSDGIYLTSNYKKINYLSFYKKKFVIFGSVHNQMDYYFKKIQSCQLVFFSPIFKTNKYSINQTLGLIKYNLICQSWNIKTTALGGINKKNIRLIKLTKGKSVGFQSLIQEM